MSTENSQFCKFYSRLEAVLKEQGISKKDFAKMLGILPQQLSRYKKTYMPSPEILVRMAETLAVSTDYLLGVNTPVNSTGEELDELSPEICREHPTDNDAAEEWKQRALAAEEMAARMLSAATRYRDELAAIMEEYPFA